MLMAIMVIKNSDIYESLSSWVILLKENTNIKRLSKSPVLLMFCIFSICPLFHVITQHIKLSREFFTIYKTSLRFWRVLFKEVLDIHLCFPFPVVNKLSVLLEYGFQYDSSLQFYCKSKTRKANLFLPKKLTASFFNVWNTQTQMKKKIKVYCFKQLYKT